MKKFEGVLLCTDLDGTLLRNDKTISEENLRAIEYFKKEGGIFTFVTGRMPYFVADIYNAVRPNTYFGCINGGGLYDHIGQKYIWQSEMPKEVFELVKCVDEKFSDIGIQVNTFEKLYFCKENRTMERFREITKVPNLVRGYNEVEEPIAKIVFGSDDEEEIAALKQVLTEHPLSYKFDFIRSEQTLFEILPKGINKGVSITKLCEILKLDPDKAVAIGDYNNDVPMFAAAKVGIAVSNACDEALAAADFVTVSNEENAVAKVIYDIEKGKYIL